jgi:hypothetical protein
MVPWCQHVTQARTNIKLEETESFTTSAASQRGHSTSTIEVGCVPAHVDLSDSIHIDSPNPAQHTCA